MNTDGGFIDGRSVGAMLEVSNFASRCGVFPRRSSACVFVVADFFCEFVGKGFGLAFPDKLGFARHVPQDILRFDEDVLKI